MQYNGVSWSGTLGRLFRGKKHDIMPRSPLSASAQIEQSKKKLSAWEENHLGRSPAFSPRYPQAYSPPRHDNSPKRASDKYVPKTTYTVEVAPSSPPQFGRVTLPSPCASPR